MKKIRDLTQRFPIVFCVVFVFLSFGIMQGVSYWISLMEETTLSLFLDEIISMTWPMLLALLFGYGFAGRAEGFGRTFKAGWGMLALYGPLLLGTVGMQLIVPGTKWESFENIVIGILAMIGIGIREEFLFRGVIVNTLALKYAKDIKGLWRTTIISSAFFGFVHMTNMFFGVSFISALVQSLGAAGFGIIFTAIYLRGGNVWFLVLVHAVIDSYSLFVSYFTITEVTDTDLVNELNLASPVVMISAGVLIAYLLFRESKRQEIFDRLAALRAKLGC